MGVCSTLRAGRQWYVLTMVSSSSGLVSQGPSTTTCGSGRLQYGQQRWPRAAPNTPAVKALMFYTDIGGTTQYRNSWFSVLCRPIILVQ